MVDIDLCKIVQCICVFTTLFPPVGGFVNWSHFCLCLCLRTSAWPCMGASREVVSKSMLGQLEQYEIVKGQIWQQYYSSIEEKVKSDWFMNLYKTINVLANPSQVSLILIDFSLTTSIDLVNNQNKQNNTMRVIPVLSTLDLTYIDKRALCSIRSFKTGVSFSKS